MPSAHKGSANRLSYAAVWSRSRPAVTKLSVVPDELLMAVPRTRSPGCGVVRIDRLRLCEHAGVCDTRLSLYPIGLDCCLSDDAWKCLFFLFLGCVGQWPPLGFGSNPCGTRTNPPCGLVPWAAGGRLRSVTQPVDTPSSRAADYGRRFSGQHRGPSQRAFRAGVALRLRHSRSGNSRCEPTQSRFENSQKRWGRSSRHGLPHSERRTKRTGSRSSPCEPGDVFHHLHRLCHLQVEAIIRTFARVHVSRLS